MSDETTLLPCPFCGGEAELHSTIPTYDSFYCCICLDCGVATRFSTEAEAIAAWNTRAATTDEDFSRAVHDGSLWRRIRGHIKCHCCGLNIESVLALDGCNEHAIKHCPNCGAKVVSE